MWYYFYLTLTHSQQNPRRQRQTYNKTTAAKSTTTLPASTCTHKNASQTNQQKHEHTQKCLIHEPNYFWAMMPASRPRTVMLNVVEGHLCVGRHSDIQHALSQGQSQFISSTKSTNANTNINAKAAVEPTLLLSNVVEGYLCEETTPKSNMLLGLSSLLIGNAKANSSQVSNPPIPIPTLELSVSQDWRCTSM